MPIGGTALMGDVRPVGGFETRQDPEQGALAGALASGQYHTGPRQDVKFRDLEQAPARYVLAQVREAQQGRHGRMVPSSCRKLGAKFRTRASNSRTRPSAMPWANSPLLVSEAMTVGMLRV